MLFQDVMYLTNNQMSMLLEEYTYIYHLRKSVDHRINKKAIVVPAGELHTAAVSC